MAGELEVGTLSGRVELEDRMSGVLELLGHRVEEFDGKFGGFGAHVAEQATSFFTAEAALEALKETAHLAGETLESLFLEGGKEVGIRESFEHLTESAHIYGEELIKGVQTATHGLVEENAILARVNQDMAAGLTLTTSQYQTLAEGARSLARATGGDVKTALDSMSDAMLTGRTRSIALLTGKIDLAKAEDDFAAKLGVTVDKLSGEGKLQATREAILRAVGNATQRVGEQTEDLAEKIEHGQVIWKDFMSDLGVAVATSPVVITAFDGIGQVLTSTFGSDKQELVQTVTHYINEGALAIVNMAEYSTDAVGIIGTEWNAAKIVFGDIAQVIEGDVLVFKYLAEGVAGFMAVLQVPGAAENVRRIDAEIQKLLVSMSERGRALQEDKKAEEDWAVATGNFKDKLEQVRQKMLEAGKTEQEAADEAKRLADAHRAAASGADAHAGAEGRAGLVIGRSREEIKKYNDALKEMATAGGSWQATLDTIDGSVVEAIKYYLDAGVAQDKLAAAYELTTTQINAVEQARKAENAGLKVEAETALKLSELWTTYAAKRAELYGDDSEKAQAAADKDYEIRVKELQDKGVTDVTYYDQLWELRNKDVQLSEEQRLLSDANSKASLEKKLSDAEKYFAFMEAHRDQYKQKDIDATAEEIKRLREMRDTWGEVGNSIDKDTEKVRTLSGEVLTLKEYEARQLGGNSITYDLSTDAGLAYFKQMNPAAQINWSDDKIEAFFKKGGTLQQLIEKGIINLYANMGGAGNWNGANFANGGAGDFGTGTLAMLHGKEIITPIDKVGALAGDTTEFNNHFYVNGTSEDVANQIFGRLMTQLKSVRKWPAAT
jgi:hypothetical protein